MRINSKACLLAAMPSSKIFDPMTTFASEEELGELSNLVSSGGVSIWKEGDPVHLTEAAYGGIAEHLVARECLHQVGCRPGSKPPAWKAGWRQQRGSTRPRTGKRCTRRLQLQPR